MVLSARELAARLDHTLLTPEASADDIRILCDEALEYTFAAVCVNGAHVPLATRRLEEVSPPHIHHVRGLGRQHEVGPGLPRPADTFLRSG